ncbi:aminotransferase class IV [Pleomorphovibrio marinus]|uniref:aminotransferase class IV n=1 Tax=Pleomorphovibrio marinus TaxID=2164132 RepID=UPI000E0A993E|nr:aminotransferase class IV [Pleomorphovibrio marinus]
MKPFCFAKDKIISSHEASCHPLDIGLIRGYAIFDFFRTVNYQGLFLEEYLERFTQSAKMAFLPLDFEKEALKEIITTLIEKNDHAKGGIRMLLTGGISPNHFLPAKGDLYIFCEPLQLPSEEKYARGVKLLSVDYVRPIPTIKTTNYTLPCLLSVDWKTAGAEDVLYHHQGVISESSRSNVFIVKDGIISTPKSNILLGITRRHTMELAREVQVRDIALKEVFEADEVFITSTTKRILPITQLDDQEIADGKVGSLTRSLMNQFEAMEKEEVMA